MDGQSLYEANLNDYYIVLPDGSQLGGKQKLNEDVYKRQPLSCIQRLGEVFGFCWLESENLFQSSFNGRRCQVDVYKRQKLA